MLLLGSSDQRWYQGDERSRAQGKFSGSIFEDPDGLPSGVFKLRVTANESGLSMGCAEISRAIINVGISVIEVSDKSYPNQRGSGMRVYLTCQGKG